MNTNTIELRFAALEAQSTIDRDRLTRSERKLRATWMVSALTALTMLLLGWHKDAIAQGYGMTLAQAATRIAALESKTSSMSVVAASDSTNTSGQTTVRFSDVNVQIVDGTGATEGTQSGLGNLIIGYNELRGGSDVRTGNHNVVAGVRHNYNGNGGVVFGYQNSISGAETTVTGGALNSASSNQASVTGGYGNSASATYASVTGGTSNTASNSYSSASGGNGNTASGYASCASGGFGNTASASYASVFGGQLNMASGLVATSFGGVSNKASGDNGSVSGGNANNASGNGSSISGGQSNTASGSLSSVSGGTNRTISTQRGWAAGTGTGTAYTGTFSTP